MQGPAANLRMFATNGFDLGSLSLVQKDCTLGQSSATPLLKQRLRGLVALAVLGGGLALLGAYVYGPENLGLRSGLIPTDLANLTIANFPLLVLGSFGVGALLAAAAALKIRSEHARVLAA